MSDKTKRTEIFDEIASERERQDEKFGEQNHAPMEWLPILMEEVGEASKEAVDVYFKFIDEEDPDGFTKMKLKNYRAEMIQVAAVAVSMIECFDRDNDKPR